MIRLHRIRLLLPASRPETVSLLLGLSCFLLHASNTPAASPSLGMQEVSPAPSNEVLLNPGMGVSLAAGTRLEKIPSDAWFLEVANIAYFRMNWCDVEPEEGADMNAYFGPIFEDWVGRLKGRVAFRVMSECTGRTRYVTPKWVFDKGVPSVLHKSSQAGDEQVDPVFWSPEYLDQACRFIRRLGRVLDGRPGLEWVDIGQIGEWGEMHLGQHMVGRWTGEQLAQTGFTHAKFVAAYRRIIDTFAEAFPHTQVFLNVGSHGEINRYAGIKGIHFRQDGLSPSGPSANVGELYYVPWSRRGIKGNYEFHSALPEMQRKGWDLHATILKGLVLQRPTS